MAAKRLAPLPLSDISLMAEESGFIPDYETVTLIIEANTEAKREPLREKFLEATDLFGDGFARPGNAGTAEYGEVLLDSLRTLMHTVLRLRYWANHSQDLSKHTAFDPKTATMTPSVIPGFDLILPMGKSASNDITAEYKLPLIKSNEYRKWLLLAEEQYRKTTPLLLSNEEKTLSQSQGMMTWKRSYSREQKPGIQSVIDDCSRDIVNYHLAGTSLRLVADQLVVRSDSKITDLWYLLALQMSEGRIGLCRYCGRPFISINARGQIRKFCGGSCKVQSFKKENK